MIYDFSLIYQRHLSELIMVGEITFLFLQVTLQVTRPVIIKVEKSIALFKKRALCTISFTFKRALGWAPFDIK